MAEWFTTLGLVVVTVLIFAAGGVFYAVLWLAYSNGEMLRGKFWLAVAFLAVVTFLPIVYLWWVYLTW